MSSTPSRRVGRAAGERTDGIARTRRWLKIGISGKTSSASVIDTKCISSGSKDMQAMRRTSAAISSRSSRLECRTYPQIRVMKHPLFIRSRRCCELRLSRSYGAAFLQKGSLTGIARVLRACLKIFLRQSRIEYDRVHGPTTTISEAREFLQRCSAVSLGHQALP
jgi:hypothetical protein